MPRFALILLALVALAGTAHAAEPTRQDLATLGKPAIKAMQRRLAEAGCYKGPLDGAASPETKAAADACPDQRPFLRVETGMHLADTRGLGVDAKCRLMATGSADKTVRLWSLPDGRALKVIRWPIGNGSEGEVNAVALSPDGRFVAVGGRAAQAIGKVANGVSIFETAGGGFVAHADIATKPIIRLAFSPDGKWLAVSVVGEGVHLLDAANWHEMAADTAYAAGGDVYGLSFGSDGTLYAAALDGTLRRYSAGPGLTKAREVRLRGAKQAVSVAVDPTGQRLAVGYYNKLAVDFYDAATLAYRGHADTRGLRDGDFSFLAWQADGAALLGGGLFGHAGQTEVVLFDRDGRRIGTPPPVASNSVGAMLPCGAGFAFTALDPVVGLLDGEGKVVFEHAGAGADMSRKLDGLLAMPDGKTVRFGLGRHDADPVAFDLAKGTVKKSLVASVPYGSALTGNLPVKGWDSTFHPTLGGRPIALDANELSRSLAVNHTPTGFVLGTSHALRAYDGKGELRWKKTAPGEAWGVIFSAEDEVVIAAYGDGTIRWHRWSDGTELLALFVNKITRAWVAWTPSGYYLASPGGEDMIGQQINRGWTQTADFFPASTFRDTYARPDVVERMLDTLDETTALREANAARADGGRIAAKAPAPVTEVLPPVVNIASPAEGAAVGARVTIDYTVRSPSGLPLQSVQALVDGRPAATARGLARAADLDALSRCLASGDAAPPRGCAGRLMAEVPPGRSEIGLVATAGGHLGAVARVRVERTDAEAPVAALKPKLYALVVGISAYRNKDYALAFPAKDAHDFAAALANQKDGLYSNVEVRTVIDGAATAKAIREGLDWLTKQVTSRDVGLVYLAGHGVLDERDRFYFLAADSDGQELRATAVPRDDIADALDGVAGKALLFLDACHAGAMAGTNGRRDTVDIDAVVNDFAHTESGVVVYAASTGRQVSQENESWGNGAFTKALIEGLGAPGEKAKADFAHNGAITTSELDAYVTERVKGLTGGAQSPVMIRPATVPDFPLAVAR